MFKKNLGDFVPIISHVEKDQNGHKILVVRPVVAGSNPCPVETRAKFEEENCDYIKVVG